MTQQLELDNKQEEILDSVLEQALSNVENFEGIKSGIIRRGALDLFHAGVTKSKIAGLLINKLAKDKELSKKTGITKYLVYKVLREPEFKSLKSQKHVDSAKGRGKNQNLPRFDVKTRQIPMPTCLQILTEEVRKLKEQYSGLSNKELRNRASELDSVKQFSTSRLEKEWPKVLPLYKTHGQSEPTVSVRVPQQDIDEQKLRADLINRIELLQSVLHWLSGMEEWQRRQFEKELPKGHAYSLALRDKCKNHMTVLIRMMPEDYIPTFLKYMNELTHLAHVFDEELYNEKLLREKKRDLGSV